MKRKTKKCIGKSIVVALLLMTVSLHTTEAAVQNSSDLTETVAASEMIKYDLYKSSAVDKKARNAYKRYIKNYLSSKEQFPYSRTKLCDINDDGTPEMFFSYTSGVRSAYKIYTYKKGKIIKMKEPDLCGCNFITYNKNKKQIYVFASNGASHAILICYKMASNKLKQISEYECISDYSETEKKELCYKNGKRISVKKYKTFFNNSLKLPTI